MTDKSNEEYAALLSHINSVLAERTSTATVDRIGLRDAVCEYVAVEKARGKPLKGILLTVNQILRKAEEGSSRASDELAKQLIAWCMEFHRPLALS